VRLSALPKGPLHLLGYRQDVDRLLLASDALLLPSRIEGLPLVYLEAAARRRPVVASRAALACFGALAAERALVVPDDDLLGYARALEQAVQPQRVQAVVEEAFHQAATQDRAAMYEAYISALRGLCALHTFSPV
jgi:glycosyltransferase involved in cell wall biosynthesis